MKINPNTPRKVVTPTKAKPGPRPTKPQAVVAEETLPLEPALEPIEEAPIEGEEVTEPAVKQFDGHAALNAILAKDSGPRFDEHLVTFKGESYRVYAKKLSYRGAVQTGNKRLTRNRMGQQVMDEVYAGTIGYAHQIHDCLFRNIAEGEFEENGKPAEPVWMPLYSVEELAGENGLMVSEDPDVTNLLYQLLGAVWKTNPELSAI